MKVIGDLEIIGIRDANKPKERVILRAFNLVDLEWYALINTKWTKEDNLSILNDHVFWFPSDVKVEKGEYVRVYTTKEGVYEKIKSKYGNEDAVFHDFYWGLKGPIWDMTNSNAVTIFRIKSWETAGQG